MPGRNSGSERTFALLKKRKRGAAWLLPGLSFCWI
jgi:hypothetical protein